MKKYAIARMRHVTAEIKRIIAGVKHVITGIRRVITKTRRTIAAGTAILLIIVIFTACSSQKEDSKYGVFIGISPENTGQMAGYETVVVDAAYFTEEQINALRQDGKTDVYSYLNIGAVEDFRGYYSRFESITLGDYENWPGERWVNTADSDWREFVCSTLAGQLAEKGITGFFIDNIDVYYNYPTEDIYRGISDILIGLSEYGLDIVVNGGDTFVREAVKRGDLEGTGVTGVNQECVYTAIDFKNESFYRQPPEEIAYFKDYLSLCKDNGLAVYVTEYAGASDFEIREEIIAFCAKNDYGCYISETVELDGGH